jgi:hypothetical protein
MVRTICILHVKCNNKFHPCNRLEDVDMRQQMCADNASKRLTAMSELGNKVKALRGDQPQQAFALKVGLSLRTVCKLEAGEGVSLETVRQLAKALRLADATRLELMVCWLKLQLGEDFGRLVIQVKEGPQELQESNDLPAQIQVAVIDLPHKLQEQLHLMLKRPEILGCLASLNALYDELKRKSVASGRQRSKD